MKSYAMVRKALLGAMSTLSVLILAGCPCIGPNTVIFQDRALESAVRAQLGTPFGCLNQSDLLQVTELQASGLAVRSLQGLEACANLLDANLADNELRSISALAGLSNLTHLDLSNNQITNIEALSGLFFLQTLALDGNLGIRDWSPLTANVANGGFPEGGTLTVSAEAVEDEEGNLLPSFQQAVNALNTAGVDVLILGAR